MTAQDTLVSMNMKCIASVLFVLGGLQLFGIAFAGELSIQVSPPDGYKALHQDASWNLVLSGEIDSDSPRRVAAALKKIGANGADVYLASPGGDLLAAMKIGRLIREAGANTHIGGVVRDTSMTLGGLWIKGVSGDCISACSLAFLGGNYRYADKGSRYGVHRFFTESGPAHDDLDIAQVVSAAVANYIREMGADARLFDLMVREGKDSVTLLSEADLVLLNVVNNGRKLPQWSIEAVEGGQYLRGTQDSVNGRGKVVLGCLRGEIYYLSFYQAGSVRAQSVASGRWVHSLMVDQRTSPLTKPAKVEASGDEIRATFVLTREQAAAITSASSVGHAMQLAYDAPTFVGYQIDIPASSIEKIAAYIRNCLNRK